MRIIGIKWVKGRNVIGRKGIVPFSDVTKISNVSGSVKFFSIFDSVDLYKLINIIYHINSSS